MKPAHYQDYVFFRLDDGAIMPVPHHDYVSLMHRSQPMRAYAKKHVRLAIFYVEMDHCRPVAIVNATYNLIEFDESGFAHPPATKHSFEDNRAFFEAVRHSQSEDIDHDPQIQKMRARWGEEFSWLPTRVELNSMLQSIFDIAGS